MSDGQNRLELLVDLREAQGQRALVLPALTAEELVREILHEFRALGYLGDTPAHYWLLRAGDRSVLDPAAPLGKEIGAGERLILVEQDLPLPEQTRRPTKHIYLRDEGSGKVYKLHWQPALIGRASPGQQQNALLAVDLADHPQGLRVSRCQAQIEEKDGQFYIRGLSPNPTAIKGVDGSTTTLDAQRRPLQGGEIVCLERSQIALRFVIHEKEPAL
jgi:hypothetical protein